MIFLTAEELLFVAQRAIGADVVVRDLGLLESAAARPQASAFGQDAYATLEERAAALVHSLVNNHALVDGNKRLGWLTTAVFLELNAIAITTATNDDVYDLVITVASSPISVDEIADRLRNLIAPASQ